MAGSFRAAGSSPAAAVRPVSAALPEVAGQGFVELLDQVYSTGEPFIGRAVPVRLKRQRGATIG